MLSELYRTGKKSEPKTTEELIKEEKANLIELERKLELKKLKAKLEEYK